MNKELGLRVLEVLEQAQKRPGLFFPSDVSGFQGFLGAVHSFYWIVLDMEPRDDITSNITEQHGWTKSALGPWLQMEEKGLSLQEIINEILEMEIEALRTYLVE